MPDTQYHIPNIDPVLSQSVCAALYQKRQGLREVPIDMEKMVVFFKSDRVTLTKIIQWYETQLLDTRFIYNQVGDHKNKTQ